MPERDHGATDKLLIISYLPGYPDLCPPHPSALAPQPANQRGELPAVLVN